MFISVIILAAGESKRMGQAKQLLPLGQSTILEQSIDNFLHSKVNEVVVVVGYKSRETIDLISNRQVKVALNPNYSQGMGSSIIAGLNSINHKAKGIMLGLADQPFISSQTIDCLTEAFAHHSKNIIIPSYKGKRGHPIVFPHNYKKELSSLKGDIGAREIIARHPEDILEIAVDCDGVTNDIDTIDEYVLGTKEIILDKTVWWQYSPQPSYLSASSLYFKLSPVDTMA